MRIKSLPSISLPNLSMSANEHKTLTPLLTGLQEGKAHDQKEHSAN